MDELSRIIERVSVFDTSKKGLFYVELNEHKRMIVKSHKKCSYPKSKGFKGKRQTFYCNPFMTKIQLESQLDRWSLKLDRLDTNKSLAFITLTTSSKQISFSELGKKLESFITSIKRNFKSFAGYIRRYEVNGKLYKHIHLLALFDGKQAPRELTNI